MESCLSNFSRENIKCFKKVSNWESIFLLYLVCSFWRVCSSRKEAECIHLKMLPNNTTKYRFVCKFCMNIAEISKKKKIDELLLTENLILKTFLKHSCYWIKYKITVRTDFTNKIHFFMLDAETKLDNFVKFMKCKPA